jgi:BolA protein
MGENISYREVVTERLKQVLENPIIEIHEDMACNGHCHMELVVESSSFNGKSLVEQHRLVNQQLGDLMQSKIHALKLKTLSPK